MKLHAKLLCGLSALLIISAGCGEIEETKFGSSFISNNSSAEEQPEPTAVQTAISDVEETSASEVVNDMPFEEKDSSVVELVDRVDYIMSRDKTVTGNSYVGYFELYGLYEKTDKYDSISLFDAGLQTSYEVTREAVEQNFSDSVDVESVHLRDLYQSYAEGCFGKDDNTAYLTLYGDSHEVLLFLVNNNDGTYTRFIGSSTGNYDLMCDSKLISDSYVSPCNPFISESTSSDITSEYTPVEEETPLEVIANPIVEYSVIYSTDLQCSIEAAVKAFAAAGYNDSLYRAKRDDIVAHVVTSDDKTFLFLSANQPITTVYWSDSELHPDEIIIEYIPPTISSIGDTSTNIDFGDKVTVKLPGKWDSVATEGICYSSEENFLTATLLPTALLDQLPAIEMQPGDFIGAESDTVNSDINVSIRTVVNPEKMYAKTVVSIVKSVDDEQSLWCCIYCDESRANDIIKAFSGK